MYVSSLVYFGVFIELELSIELRAVEGVIGHCYVIDIVVKWACMDALEVDVEVDVVDVSTIIGW